MENNKIKWNSAIILGTIIWILLIVLIVNVARSGFNESEARQKLVSGLAPTIALLFIFKSLPFIKIIKQWNILDIEKKILLFWGLISADFIFSFYIIYRKYIQKVSIDVNLVNH